jgi:hypothetical protein
MVAAALGERLYVIDLVGGINEVVAYLATPRIPCRNDLLLKLRQRPASLFRTASQLLPRLDTLGRLYHIMLWLKQMVLQILCHTHCQSSLGPILLPCQPQSYEGQQDHGDQADSHGSHQASHDHGARSSCAFAASVC